MKSSFLLTIYFIILFALPAFAQDLTTVAGNGTAGYGGDSGQAVDAEINQPYHVFIDHENNLYIADADNSVVRKVNTMGIITTIAGNGIPGYSGDDGPAVLAQLHGPTGVAVDDTGSIYIADRDFCVIRKVDTFGIITTIAGTVPCGFSGDDSSATSAKLNGPSDVALDHSGNIFIADYANNRIRKINTSGIITTLAGNGTGGSIGDGGQATAAELYEPESIALDVYGSIYISDLENAKVRRVDTSGVITTIAGNGTFGFSGDGGPATNAELFAPTGLSVDSIGNIYVADALSNRIRKINTSGVISTVAGSGTAGFNGNDKALLFAELSAPNDVKLNKVGNMFIADQGNYRIRSIGLPTSVKMLSGNEKVHIYPNPGGEKRDLFIAADISNNAWVIVSDVIGNQLEEFETVTNQHVQLDINAPDGIYYISVLTAQNKYTQKIVVMH